jgi:hypothetical protein
VTGYGRHGQQHQDGKKQHKGEAKLGETINQSNAPTTMDGLNVPKVSFEPLFPAVRSGAKLILFGFWQTAGLPTTPYSMITRTSSI